jgi:hypothetical protein
MPGKISVRPGEGARPIPDPARRGVFHISAVLASEVLASGVRVTAQVHLGEDGQYFVDELCLKRAEGVELLDSDLRAASPARLLDAASRAGVVTVHAEFLPEGEEEAETWARMEAEAVRAHTGAQAATADAARGRRRRHRLTRVHLESVARVYTEAAERGAAPLIAICDTFAVSHSTAQKWAAKARTAGLLGAEVPHAGGRRRKDDRTEA